MCVGVGLGVYVYYHRKGDEPSLVESDKATLMDAWNTDRQSENVRWAKKCGGIQKQQREREREREI